MFEEDKLSIVLYTDEYRSLLTPEETKLIQIVVKQKGKIRKPKFKRRQRLIWVPLIMKNILKADTEPIYIYNLFKMMRSYDNDQMEKYQNYGIQDAGIGHFDSIELDKQNQNVELSLNTYSIGQMDVSYLIKLYKSYQNQQYYELAIALQDYQDFSQQHLQFLADKFSQMQCTQTQIDEVFLKFQQVVKDWLNVNFENEIYEVVIGKIDIEKKIPILKKIIYSKNLLLFIGEEIQQTYNELSVQRNFDFLSNFLRQKNLNGQNEMEFNIKLLKESTKQLHEFELDDEVQTLDGYIIPTKRRMRSYFYDSETGEINNNINVHFFLLTKYSFEPKWIKYLIDKRLNKPKIDQNERNHNSILQQSMDQNFEYVCQKEYFLEKFNYKSQINS